MRKTISSFRGICLCLFLVLGSLAIDAAFLSVGTVSAGEGALPKKVIIACSTDAAPFHFIDEFGHPAGMAIDLWNLWSQKTGIEVEFRFAPWAEALEMMREGRADIHAGLFYTEGRDAFLDYAAPLFRIDTHFFYHENIFGLSRLEDLRGFNIGILEGDFAVDYIEENLPGATLVTYPDYQALFRAAQEREIRVFVIDTLTGLHHMADKSIRQEFEYNLGEPLYTRPFFAAVKQSDLSLLGLVTRGVESISPAERAAIQRKWMGSVELKSPDVLTVAISYKYRPFSRLDADGRPAGMLVDLWRLWSEKTGKKVEFLMTDWAGTLNAMESGAADIHSGLYRTEKRLKSMDFSQPFYQVPSNLFYPVEQGRLASLEDLAGHRVGVQEGAYQGEFLREFFPEMEVVEYPSLEAIIRDAGQGRIRAFFEEAPVAFSLLNRQGKVGEFAQLGDSLLREKIHAAVRKGNSELLTLVDEGLSAIGRKEMAEIEKRWMLFPQMRQMDKPLIRLTAAEEAWLKKHRSLRLGVDLVWPPFEFIDENGDYQGIGADYVDLVSRRLGVAMTPLPGLSWEQVLEKAKAGELDVIPSVVQSPQRKEYLEFTSPYISFPLVIVARNDAPFIAGLTDLRGKDVALVKGYVVQDFLDRDFPELHQLPSKDVSSGLKAVSSGRAYAFIGNLAAVSFAIKKEGLTNLKVSGTTPYSYDLSFAVRKDWAPLVPILEKALESITGEEKDRIYNKWVSMRYEHGTDWGYVWRWIAFAAGIALAVLAAVVIWNRRLAREVNRRTAELKEVGDKISAILKSVPDALVVTDLERRVILMNRAAERLFGVPLKDLFLRHLETVVKDPSFPGRLARLFEAQTPGGLMDVDLLDHDSAGIRTYEVGTSSVETPEGARKGVIVVLRDVTGVREADRLKSEFIMTAAHELSTPLTAIMGYAELLLNQDELGGFEKEQQREFLETIFEKGEGLSGLVDELLQLSRMEVGRALQLEKASCAIEEVIRSTMDEHRRGALGHRFELNPSGEDLEIEVDSRKIIQVLDNLLSNAVKFSPRGGIVRVSVGREGRNVRVAVEDEGEGMSPEQAAMAFEKFYRADTSTTAVGGFGLGLTLARQIVEAHGGTIRLESRVGTGTKVSVLLPFEWASDFGSEGRGFESSATRH